MYTILGCFSCQADVENPGSWGPQPRCRGSVDLASVGQIIAARPGEPRPVGIFLCDEIPAGCDGAVLSSEDPRDARPDGKLLEAWESLTGYRPSGETIAALLWDHMTAGADPAGLDACGMLVPTQRGKLELWLGELIRVETFDIRAHPFAPKLMELLTGQLAAVRSDAVEGKLVSAMTGEVDFAAHRKFADALVEKYCGRNPRAKTELFAELKPAGWPAGETLVPHGTVITETFDTADGDTLGPDLSWTELAGDADVAGNRCRGVTATVLARADSDLAGSDTYALARLVTQHSGDSTLDRIAGTFVRKDGTTTATFYFSGLNSGSAVRLYKSVAGSLTQLGTDATVSVSLPQITRCSASGSTITATWDGIDVVTATDSAIASGTRCGVRLRWSAGNPELDDFEAGDLVAGGHPAYRRFGGFPSIRPWPIGQRGVRAF